MDIQIGAEFDANPINCTKTLTAAKGQKYALILLQEYYWEDNDLAGYCNGPDPTACISSVSVVLSGGSGAASVSSVATATSKSPGNWTGQEMSPGVTLWTRYEFKLLDVSACTLTTDCDLTLQLQTVRSTVRNFHGFELHVDANFGFSMENTQWNYRPEDSTDTTNSGSLPSSPSPVSAKPLGPGRKLHSTCTGCPDGTKATYFAFIPTYGNVNPEALAAQITFELSLPKGVTGYRPGSSSNFGQQTASDPDFKFLATGNDGFNAPTSNGQSITTAGAVNGASVTVTSFDYGGVALLRAKVQIGGFWIYASSSNYDELGVIVPAPRCAVEENDNRDFVQIPIDMDCNWIADSWELQPAMSRLQTSHFPKYWDGEKTGENAAPEVVVGDGFGAYDEYRGFHLLTTEGSPTHKRLNPEKLESFYGLDPASELLSESIGTILKRELMSEQPSPNQIVIFYKLAPDQYLLDPNDSHKARVLNKNTESESNPSNYPNILRSLGSASADCAGSRIGYALGKGKDPGVIGICADKIILNAGPNFILQRTALASVVAHEYGHRFNLDHYKDTRVYYPSLVNDSAAAALSAAYYAESQFNMNTFYSKIRYSSNGVGASNLDSPDTDSAPLKSVCNPLISFVLSPNLSIINTAQEGLGLFSCPSALRDEIVLYKEPIKFQIYRMSTIMSWIFAYSLENIDSSAHHFSSSSPNDISLIQLN